MRVDGFLSSIISVTRARDDRAILSSESTFGFVEFTSIFRPLLFFYSAFSHFTMKQNTTFIRNEQK